VIALGLLAARGVARDAVDSFRQRGHPQWEIARGLRQLGVQPGDRVASIGDSFMAYWARLAGVTIIAEIPCESAELFWAADAAVKSQVLRKFANAGARVVIAQGEKRLMSRPSCKVPKLDSPPGWTQVDRTGYYAFFLPSEHDTAWKRH